MKKMSAISPDEISLFNILSTSPYLGDQVCKPVLPTLFCLIFKLQYSSAMSNNDWRALVFSFFGGGPRQLIRTFILAFFFVGFCNCEKRRIPISFSFSLFLSAMRSCSPLPLAGASYILIAKRLNTRKPHLNVSLIFSGHESRLIRHRAMMLYKDRLSDLHE